MKVTFLGHFTKTILKECSPSEHQLDVSLAYKEYRSSLAVSLASKEYRSSVAVSLAYKEYRSSSSSVFSLLFINVMPFGWLLFASNSISSITP